MTQGSEIVITGTTDLSGKYVADHKLRTLDVSQIKVALLQRATFSNQIYFVFIE
jgi:hypothetical protein